ncbi:hypothetical protein [Marinitenerispora sediminis]|uniref:Uncharacterized protein n=1 Tax=Marinitenerispora sediminis TaxID=1931232 RepID=A0A368SZG8_9ACTN|nr:hypothetical protein [Marinitenerispora sediminis]RCV48121.1 hypothetical protein DEF28_24440 [Marinitenerispora sediminis]RCV51076.1 hypothetical protein DEF24_23570 [Marinitenerispora sediminis]RCV60744.1 hypothetical protein DEF23_04065 [Marinitenerispora sediminis]
MIEAIPPDSPAGRAMRDWARELDPTAHYPFETAFFSGKLYKVRRSTSGCSIVVAERDDFRRINVAEEKVVPAGVIPARRAGPQALELALAEARSRRTGYAAPPRATPDIEGHDLRPDPLRARSPEAFVEAMRAFRVWAGEPSYRAMQSRCGRRVAASTFCTALKSNDMPKLGLVEAFVEACGGDEAEKRRWTTAWRRVSMRDYTRTDPRGSTDEFYFWVADRFPRRDRVVG